MVKPEWIFSSRRTAAVAYLESPERDLRDFLHLLIAAISRLICLYTRWGVGHQ